MPIKTLTSLESKGLTHSLNEYVRTELTDESVRGHILMRGHVLLTSVFLVVRSRVIPRLKALEGCIGVLDKSILPELLGDV